jgi:hypothetical protein
VRPVRELPAEAARELVGVAFDVDDTVTRHGRLEPEAFAALWALHRAGLLLVAVTGRPLGWTDVLARQWPVALAVGENGAGWSWVDRREGGSIGVFRQGYFEPDPARRAAQGARLAALRTEAEARLPELPVADDQAARRCDLAFDIGERRPASPEETATLLELIRDRGLRAQVSSVHAHAIPGAWDKASGTRAALAAWDASEDGGSPGGGELDGWLYVGDSPNDAEAFAAFPRSVGVANLKEHDLGGFPRLPDFVTEGDRGRGFAELAEVLLGHRVR